MRAWMRPERIGNTNRPEQGAIAPR